MEVSSDCEQIHLLEKGVEPLPSNKLLEKKISSVEAEKGIYVSKRMGVAVGLLWIASIGYVARTGVDPLELESSSAAITGSTPSMFKRTHLSINSIKEGIWLKRTFGFGDVMNEYWEKGTGVNSLDFNFGMDSNARWEEEALAGHNHDDMEICAARSIFSWTDIGETNVYNWHEFQGSQTPEGDLGSDYWWDLIYKMNTEENDDAWSVFLHKGTHFYLKDLSNHMDVFVEDSTPHLTRTYTNIVDGGKMYVVFVPNAYNGNTVILHGRDVSSAHRDKFVSLEATACDYAVAMPYSRSNLDEWYDSTYVSTKNLEDLPKPMPVGDSQPTFDMDEVVAYFDKLNIDSMQAITSLHEISDTCKVFSINLATQFQTAYEARFVYTPNARGFETVGKFHKYVDTEVRKTTGFNEGYSRWLDEHWAITVRDSISLDQLRFNLEDSNTPYHAHVTEIIDGNSAGSIWAWGVSGMAIEWHSSFDYTTFHDPIGGFDFCTTDTVCQDADINCLSISNPDAANSNVAGATR